MKVFGLVSGGKDSCFNLMHCVKNGHELVALGSLLPEATVDELDSNLYQSVGLNAAHKIAEAMGLPHHTARTKGTRTSETIHYGSRRKGGHAQARDEDLDDETEDLFRLLQRAQRDHDFQAVAVGAIQSDYQRLRVEHVCSRLDLVVLAYLWNREQRELLSEMIVSGLEAILIKVAAMGLSAVHLGQTLTQMQPTLVKLARQYDLQTCGEGGEYETFTLDCPLFEKKLKLAKSQVVSDQQAFAPVAYLRLLQVEAEHKVSRTKVIVPIPALLSDSEQSCYESMSKTRMPTSLQRAPSRWRAPSPHLDRAKGSWLAVCRSTDSSHGDLTEQIKYCFTDLESALEKHDMSLEQVVSVTVLLAKMSDFTVLNSVYKSFFGVLPPVRACVGSLDTYGEDGPTCQIDMLATTRPTTSTIHVQSISYWAPANIGPYSQAVLVEGQVFVSGQIGLVPATMEFPQLGSNERDVRMEHCLALRHARSVASAARSDPDKDALSAICWLTDSSHVSLAMAAWDAQQCPDIGRIFVIVSELPKTANVEWQIAYGTDRWLPDQDAYGATVKLRSASLSSVEDTWHLCETSSGIRHGFATTKMEAAASSAALNAILHTLKEPMKDRYEDVLTLRIFSTREITKEQVEQSIRTTWLCNSLPCVITIPAREIFDADGRACSMALHILAVSG